MICDCFEVVEEDDGTVVEVAEVTAVEVLCKEVRVEESREARSCERVADIRSIRCREPYQFMCTVTHLMYTM